MEWPEGVRVDTWVETGSHVTPYYDSLLAKLMVFAPTRAEAIAKLVDALSKTKVRGTVLCEGPVFTRPLIGSPINFADCLIGSPTTSQSTGEGSPGL